MGSQWSSRSAAIPTASFTCARVMRALWVPAIGRKCPTAGSWGEGSIAACICAMGAVANGARCWRSDQEWQCRIGGCAIPLKSSKWSASCIVSWIRLDYDEIEKLFFRRRDDPSLPSRAGSRPISTIRRRTRSGASREQSKHRSRSVSKIEKDLFTQKTRLVTAERSFQRRRQRKRAKRSDLDQKDRNPQTKLSRLQLGAK